MDWLYNAASKEQNPAMKYLLFLGFTASLLTSCQTYQAVKHDGRVIGHHAKHVGKDVGYWAKYGVNKASGAVARTARRVERATY